MNTAIIVAAGKSKRMGLNIDKAFLSLGPRPVIAWSLLAFEECADIDQIILVVKKDQIVAAESVAKMFGIAKVRKVIPGGARRQDSVQNGLNAMDADTRIVVTHDCARPCVTPELISNVVKAAKRYGSGVAAAPVVDTIKCVERGMTVDRTLDRSKLWAVQTPQAFSASLLIRAYKEVAAKKAAVTDEAGAVEQIGEPVRLVEWKRPNPKITMADDLAIASAVIQIV